MINETHEQWQKLVSEQEATRGTMQWYVVFILFINQVFNFENPGY